MEREPHATTEELLAHAGWVRALSRALVADPHAAADLEQDAWVAALEHPPRTGEGLRAWWSRVVRNEATDSHRVHDRRARREADVGPAPETPTPLETNAALDAHRRLAAAIERLDEPLRATVIRRYLQGLTSTRIAEMDSVPESTVRTRLQRALEVLRRDLDERTPGGRAAWSAMLAPLAVHAPEIATTTAVVGIALKTKMTVAAAVLVAAVGGAFVAGFFDVAVESDPILASASLGRSNDLAPVSMLDSTPREPARLDVVPTEDSSSASTGVEAAATITARFVTAAGHPIAGATLTSLDRAGTGELTLEEAPTAVSGADGHVELALRTSDRSKRRGMRSGMPPGTWDPVVEAGGRGWARTEVHPTATLGSVTSLGDVILSEGADVRGRCLGEDGAPLAGLSVQMIHSDLSLADRDAIERDFFWRSDRIAGAKTTEDGSFAMSSVPIGAFRIHVNTDGRRQAISAAFELAGGDDFVVPDLVVERNVHAIRGRVLLPDGTPGTRTEVGWQYGELRSWVSESTDRDGAFLIPVESNRAVDLCAYSSTKKYGDALLLGVIPGSDDVVLQLTEPRWIDVLVTDESGAPIEEYELGAKLADGASRSSERMKRPGGRARYLVRARPHLLHVAAVGFVHRQLGPFTLADAPATLTIALTRAGLVRGTIRRDGEPEAGVDVNISPLFDAPRVRRDALPQRAGESLSSAITDAAGNFALGAETTGPHVVWTQFRDGTVLESEAITIERGRTIEGLVLDTQRTGTLEGRVLTRPDARSEAAQVILSNGLPEVRTIAVTRDGTFDAEGLAPGTWTLRFAPEPRHRDELVPTGETIEDPTSRSFEIRTQRTTQVEVDLRQLEARAVEGSIRFANRAPRAWTASLTPEGEQNARRTAAPILADATFDLASEWVGGHTLALRSSGTALRDDRIEARIVLGPRTQHFDLALELGELDLAGPAGAQRELRIALANGATWITNFRFDAEGRALLDGLPRGEVAMRVPGEDAIRFETTIGAAKQPTFRVP